MARPEEKTNAQQPCVRKYLRTVRTRSKVEKRKETQIKPKTSCAPPFLRERDLGRNIRVLPLSSLRVKRRGASHRQRRLLLLYRCNNFHKKIDTIRVQTPPWTKQQANLRLRTTTYIAALQRTPPPPAMIIRN